MPGLKIESGIDKSVVDDRIWVGKNGIEGDEHDLTFHGGPTKAVHACKQHTITNPDNPLLLWNISFLRKATIDTL